MLAKVTYPLHPLETRNHLLQLACWKDTAPQQQGLMGLVVRTHDLDSMAQPCATWITSFLCTCLPICNMSPVIYISSALCVKAPSIGSALGRCSLKVGQLNRWTPAATLLCLAITRHAQRAIHPPPCLLNEIMVTRWGESLGAIHPADSQNEPGSEHFLLRSGVL